MNTPPRPLVPCILLALAACPARADDTAVQIYGRLNIGLERVSQQHAEDDGPRLRESNYRSVLGFRGDEDLGGGLHVIFQIEGTLSPDTGAGSIAARDTRVGLTGSWGTLFGGNWTTPYTAATAGFDAYYPTTAGYMSLMGNGSAATSDNVIDKTSFDRRQQNTVNYVSPTWRGLSLRLTQGLNEEKPANGARPSLTSSALIYENGPWYLTAAAERHHEYQGPGLDDLGAKLGAAYQFGHTRLALAAERLRYETPSGRLARNAVYVSLTHQIGAQRLNLGVARAGDGSGPATGRYGYLASGPGTGAVHVTLGYDYALSKRTTLFALYSRIHNDSRAAYDFAINGIGAEPGGTPSAAVLGMRTAF